MKRRPNRYQRFLTGVGGVADRCVAVTQSHAVAIRRVGTAILITLVIVVVTLLVWLCVLVPWREVGEAIVDAPWDQVAVVAGMIAGGGLLGGAVVTLIIFVGEDRFLGLGRGIKTTFLFFKDGIFTVKHRTCPNVVIRPVAAGREYCGIEHLPTKAR